MRFEKDGKGGTIKEIPGSGFCLIKSKECNGEDLDCKEREEKENRSESINKEKA
jgi:hypothetical protein